MAQVITGAKAQIKINETIVGFAGGVNVNQENTLSDVDIMGQLDTGDLAETGHKVTFSFNYFKAVENADGSGNVTNTAAQLGIDRTVSDSLDVMRNQTEFTCTIIDQSNGDLAIYTMTGCKFEGGSGQVDARGIWNGTFNFRAKQGYGL